MSDHQIHSENHYFSQFQILPTVKSSIVIPVKNEEKYILKTLDSFCEQVDVAGKPVDRSEFEILALANNCTDRTVNLIQQFQQDNPDLNLYLQQVSLPSEKANIGYVRRKLMDCAYLRLIQNDGGIIMTTDADTMVSKDWIAQNRYEVEEGAEAVGGRILLYPDELESLDEYARQYHLKDEKYQLLIAELEGLIVSPSYDPVPRHHQHFNGSFAITSLCYNRSGGVPVVKQLEDCAFYERLQKMDAKIRHSHKVTVHTSARCIGRTEVGLSYQLNKWKNLGMQMEDFMVESADSILNNLILKRIMKSIWEIKEQISKFQFFEIAKNHKLEIILDEKSFYFFENSFYFGEWYEKVNEKQISFKKKYTNVSIDTAIRDLEIILKRYSDHNFVQTSIL